METRRAFYRELGRIEAALAATPAGPLFTPEMTAGLPEAARRCLLHTIEPGTPLATSLRLRMSGTMRLAPAGRWLRLRAAQILTPSRGFVWKARVARGPLRIGGADCLLDGQAQLRFWLWGILPVVRAGGPDVARSAAGRLAMESLLCPAALLPLRGATWEPGDHASARVSLPVPGRRETITVTVDPATGALREARMERWGNQTPGGRYELTPFGAAFGDEERVAGYTLPTRISVTWRPGAADAFEFFRVRLGGIEFHR
jgi:hypothetical protein